jgi:hypothetical protein
MRSSIVAVPESVAGSVVTMAMGIVRGTESGNQGTPLREQAIPLALVLLVTSERHLNSLFCFRHPQDSRKRLQYIAMASGGDDVLCVA